MPKMVITHDVADVDTWLKFKSERADTVSGMGGRHVVDHVAGRREQEEKSPFRRDR